jgi:hypothetical protein
MGDRSANHGHRAMRSIQHFIGNRPNEQTRGSTPAARSDDDMIDAIFFRIGDDHPAHISRQSIYAFDVLDANSRGGVGRRLGCRVGILILEQASVRSATQHHGIDRQIYQLCSGLLS